MARYHLKDMLRRPDTRVVAVCEPSPAAYAATAELFDQHGQPAPSNEPDCGAHMLNTVADLAGEDFAEVAAWLEDDGRPVDIRAAVIGRLASGALVTMNACGSAIPSGHSDIRVFTTGAILRTGIWGETLEIQRSGSSRLRKVTSVAGVPVWEQFLNVRSGMIDNPSPPEVGLRMARLWDAIRGSAADGGRVVHLPPARDELPAGAAADR